MMIEPLVASYGTDQYSRPVSGSTEVTAFDAHEDELPRPPASMIVGGE